MTRQEGKVLVFGVVIRETLLKALCALVLCSVLVAGLWPFHAPKNQITWLSDGKGVLLGKYGTIVSAGALKANEEATPCSLEIWLQSNLVDYSGTILAFYRPENTVLAFKLHQFLGNLAIQRTSVEQFHHTKGTSIYVTDLFRHAEPVFITISSGPSGTTVYADGALVKTTTNFRLSNHDLAGPFIIGNAPTGNEPWTGQLQGLAVYDRELSADEVLQHYANWTKNSRSDLSAREGLVALYLFKEGHGSIVRDQVDSAANLLIPERYLVLHEKFLEPFWLEFRWRWSYWKDVGINIAGFIPLGFFFCAYLSLPRGTGRSLAITIAVGFLVSLTIEVLQAFLPTRNSGTTDLITNTFGTAIGAICCTWSMEHRWLIRTGISICSSPETEENVLSSVGDRPNRAMMTGCAG
jgi:VanZ like protein/concanavalin A-like lectin/glucanase superfamily protein